MDTNLEPKTGLGESKRQRRRVVVWVFVLCCFEMTVPKALTDALEMVNVGVVHDFDCQVRAHSEIAPKAPTMANAMVIRFFFQEERSNICQPIRVLLLCCWIGSGVANRVCDQWKEEKLEKSWWRP